MKNDTSFQKQNNTYFFASTSTHARNIKKFKSIFLKFDDRWQSIRQVIEFVNRYYIEHTWRDLQAPLVPNL